MIKFLLFIKLQSLLVFLLCFTQIAHASEPANQPPTARYGSLSVQGRQLCDVNGTPVQLRGMSTHGLQWYGWPESLTASSLDVLAYEWKADIVRLSMYPDEGGYKTDPLHYQAMINLLIDEVVKRGLYAIIDWHMLTPGDPWSNIDEAKKFFSYMSSRHGKNKFVFYEICNEPNGDQVNWARIKSYAEEVIPVIRQNAPDSLILVGTPDWSSLSLSGACNTDVIDNPLQEKLAKNVMYTFHFYAGSHKAGYRENFIKFAEKIPLFVTEWGSQKASGDGANDFNSTKEWLAILDRYKISWCNWNYSDDKRSGAVWKKGVLPKGPFTEDQLKPAGQFVKGCLLNKVP